MKHIGWFDTETKLRPKLKNRKLAMQVLHGLMS